MSNDVAVIVAKDEDVFFLLNRSRYTKAYHGQIHKFFNLFKIINLR